MGERGDIGRKCIECLIVLAPSYSADESLIAKIDRLATDSDVAECFISIGGLEAIELEVIRVRDDGVAVIKTRKCAVVASEVEGVLTFSEEAEASEVASLQAEIVSQCEGVRVLKTIDVCDLITQSAIDEKFGIAQEW